MTLRAVIMGVSGSGKSRVGAALAEALSLRYVDGDDLHPAANVAKMRAGTPLDDADRWPWLARVAEVLRRDAPVIVGCSALKHSYRDRIRGGAGGPVRFVHLTGSRSVLARRMRARQGHYMPPALLDSQLATLEPPGPDEALSVDVDRPVAALVTAILPYLKGPA